MLLVNSQLQIPLREIRFTFARSSGPGGQNVNKVSSKATLHWRPADSPSLIDPLRARVLARIERRLTLDGELQITSQRYRDAGRNVSDCLEKLRDILAEAARPPHPRKATRPTRGSVRRRLETKNRQSQKKQSRRGGGEE